MSIYVKLQEPWHRVPLLKKESIEQYKKYNVDLHKGTSYGEVERIHYEELKLAAKMGCELIKVESLEHIEVNLCP